jgi:hypothetical protein
MRTPSEPLLAAHVNRARHSRGCFAVATRPVSTVDQGASAVAVDAALVDRDLVEVLAEQDLMG